MLGFNACVIGAVACADVVVCAGSIACGVSIAGVGVGAPTLPASINSCAPS